VKMPSQAGLREAWSGSIPLGAGSRYGDRLDTLKAQRLLLTRAESAGALSMSLSHFQRHVQPALPCVRSGRLRLYRPLDLERWLESAAAGSICDPSLANMTLEGVVGRFVGAAREGVALNKWRRPYRSRAVEDLESLNRLPQKMLECHIDAVTPGEVQELIDELSEEGLSASRIGSIVNALRALYRFAQERELTSNDPARNVRLPLVLRRALNRVATPAEFRLLLKALWERTPEEIESGMTRDPREALGDALPYALAAYGTARAQEIEVLDWSHVNLATGGIELAGDEDGRKPGGAWRVVPLTEPLRALLSGEWLAQGRPRSGRVCPPRRIRKSGRKSMRSLQRRVRCRWQAQDMEPIGLHEARHTAATWLDHAGISAKVCSQIMGHKTPEYQPGAARITLERYTHVLPGELEHARERLNRFLSERT
jgi:integrase